MCAFSASLTTTVFSQRSTRRFGASPRRAAPKGQPSSLAQLRIRNVAYMITLLSAFVAHQEVWNQMTTVLVMLLTALVAITGVACADDTVDTADSSSGMYGAIELRIFTPELNPDQPRDVTMNFDPPIEVPDVEAAWNVARYEDVVVGQYNVNVRVADSPWTGSTTVDVREGETTMESISVD